MVKEIKEINSQRYPSVNHEINNLRNQCKIIILSNINLIEKKYLGQVKRFP